MEARVCVRALAVAALFLFAGLTTLDVIPRAEAGFEDQFVWPMSGEVTSIYWECRSSCARYHRGLDIANGCNTPIHASRAGSVSLVGWDPDGYGNYVILDHDHGYESLYAHMASVSVSQGQSVTTATQLGIEGSTGASSGCHVHFEVRQQGQGTSNEKKQFIPGALGETKTRGDPVPYEMRLFEVTTTRSVLDGPDIHSVPGQGDEAVGTAQAGERYVAYSSWVNGDDARWWALSFNGRIGWLPASALDEVGGTAQRVTTDGALNVRAGPGTSNTDIGDVWGGQEYHREASATDGGGATWYKILYDGSDGSGVGWIHGGYTTTRTYDAPTGGDLAGWSFAVDPGHGGTDPGAQAFGTDEKTVNLDIALQLRDLLVADGATVHMTRTTDATVSLTDRVALGNSNEVDRFVSIHANSCGSCGARGTETYYHDSLSPSSTAAALAGKVQARVVQETGTNDRGVKTADFYVLRETDMPAVLVETAFLDHADDHALLTDPVTQEAFALAVLHGIQEHLGVPVHDPQQPDPDPSVPNLESGVAVGITGAAGDEAFYKIHVPAETARAKFETQGPGCHPSSGCPLDTDLYVRYDARPSATEYDCRPYEPDSDERCDFDDPTAGWWYVRVHYYSGSGTISLVATLTDAGNVPPDPDPTTPDLESGAAVSFTVDAENADHHYKIHVPPGATRLTVLIDGPACGLLGCPLDADLYTRYGQRATDSAFDCRPYEGDSDERCEHADPQEGWWYVRVKRYSGSGTVTLKATVS